MGHMTTDHLPKPEPDVEGFKRVLQRGSCDRVPLVELAIAERVYQGRLPCELGAFVTLTADASAPGYFDLQINKLKYRMFPVISSTGAIRLEDPQAGAVWLQLANKSMLMNQKLGQRLADDCMSPDQAMVAEAMLKNPPPSLLEAPLETVTSTEVTIQ